MSYSIVKLQNITSIRTGKLNSNAATIDGEYPFFTCDPITLRTNTYSFDAEAILLAGNNASGNYTAKYYNGKFEVYQRTYVIQSIDCDILNIRYLGYAMSLKLYELKMMSSGSTTKFLTIGMLHNLEIPLPSINKQNYIVDILSAYDNFIENNQKQIKLLEEAAMRLYKEWFVKLRFPGYETTKTIDGAPEGWTNCLLQDIADVNKRSIGKNYNYENIQYIDIGSVREGVVETKTSYNLKEAPGRAKRLASDGDIIWGMVRPNLKSYALILSPSENEVYSTGFAILTPIGTPFSYLYCFVTQPNFIGYLINCTNGAAYPAVKAIHFEQAQILVPKETILTDFNRITEPYFRKIKCLLSQNEKLRQSHDKLLPKLMNGEIEV